MVPVDMVTCVLSTGQPLSTIPFVPFIVKIDRGHQWHRGDNHPLGANRLPHSGRAEPRAVNSVDSAFSMSFSWGLIRLSTRATPIWKFPKTEFLVSIALRLSCSFAITLLADTGLLFISFLSVAMAPNNSTYWIWNQMSCRLTLFLSATRWQFGDLAGN